MVAGTVVVVAFVVWAVVAGGLDELEHPAVARADMAVTTKVGMSRFMGPPLVVFRQQPIHPTTSPFKLQPPSWKPGK